MAKRESAAKEKAPKRRVVLNESNFGGEEHREFPRAVLEVPMAVWIGAGADRTFSATLRSENISVSGAFLRSTFFLPIKTEVNVRFSIDDDSDPVEAKGIIVREERSGDEKGGRSGFGVQFVSFSGQSDVKLARLFLGDQVMEFVEEYLDSKRAKGLGSELERVVDTLVAWELQKVSGNKEPVNPWKRG
jgi:hypothetical protein